MRHDRATPGFDGYMRVMRHCCWAGVHGQGRYEVCCTAAAVSESVIVAVAVAAAAAAAVLAALAAAAAAAAVAAVAALAPLAIGLFPCACLLVRPPKPLTDLLHSALAVMS